MSDKEWTKFFDLMKKITELEGLSWQEKRDLAKEKATENGTESALEEFVGWLWPEYEDP